MSVMEFCCIRLTKLDSIDFIHRSNVNALVCTIYGR